MLIIQKKCWSVAPGFPDAVETSALVPIPILESPSNFGSELLPYFGPKLPIELEWCVRVEYPSSQATHLVDQASSCRAQLTLVDVFRTKNLVVTTAREIYAGLLKLWFLPRREERTNQNSEMS